MRGVSLEDLIDHFHAFFGSGNVVVFPGRAVGQTGQLASAAYRFQRIFARQVILPHQQRQDVECHGIVGDAIAERDVVGSRVAGGIHRWLRRGCRVGMEEV